MARGSEAGAVVDYVVVGQGRSEVTGRVQLKDGQRKTETHPGVALSFQLHACRRHHLDTWDAAYVRKALNHYRLACQTIMDLTDADTLDWSAARDARDKATELIAAIDAVAGR